jgi:hypothetical protein
VRTLVAELDSSVGACLTGCRWARLATRCLCRHAIIADASPSRCSSIRCSSRPRASYFTGGMRGDSSNAIRVSGILNVYSIRYKLESVGHVSIAGYNNLLFGLQDLDATNVVSELYAECLTLSGILSLPLSRPVTVDLLCQTFLTLRMIFWQRALLIRDNEHLTTLPFDARTIGNLSVINNPRLTTILSSWTSEAGFEWNESP